MAIRSVLSILKYIFTKSIRLHLHVQPAKNLNEFLELADRFVDGNINYPLEWDDFISWENENVDIEKIRTKISSYEMLLFSKKKEDRLAYCNAVIKFRNEVAEILGLPAREFKNELI